MACTELIRRGALEFCLDFSEMSHTQKPERIGATKFDDNQKQFRRDSTCLRIMKRPGN
jgi:hypothetical protein